MQQSIKTELQAHVIDRINDGVLTNDNRDEWHHECFNADHYIVGYYNAEQWLKEHDVSAFDAIEAVTQWELDCLGENNLTPDDMNAERIVNLYVYCLGEELLNDISADDIAALREACE